MQEAAYAVFDAERVNMIENCEADHQIDLKNDQSWVSWCPTNDIIGVASKNSHLVEVYRLENKVERLVSSQVNSQPTALEFVRHGRYFAIGDTHGRVSILKSDTLDEMKSFVLEDSPAAISALHWSTYTQGELKATKKDDPLNFSPHLKKLETLN